MTESSYIIAGMTCGHCAAAVSDEIVKLAGVLSVDVDVPTGRVAVRSASPLSLEDVAAAVEEAGYRLVEGRPAE